MQIGVPKEKHPGENRVPLTPITVKKLIDLGAEVVVQADMGAGSGYTDSEYTDTGASVTSDRSDLLAKSDII